MNYKGVFTHADNSLQPSDAMSQHKSGSTLAQVMACCLTAPSHYLNQCFHIINLTLGNKIHWYLKQNTIIFFLENAFENAVCEVLAIFSGCYVYCNRLLTLIPSFHSKHENSCGGFWWQRTTFHVCNRYKSHLSYVVISSNISVMHLKVVRNNVADCMWHIKMCFLSWLYACVWSKFRADSRLAPSQWETSLQSNVISHWLCTNLESALKLMFLPLTLCWLISNISLNSSVKH